MTASVFSNLEKQSNPKLWEKEVKQVTSVEAFFQRTAILEAVWDSGQNPMLPAKGMCHLLLRYCGNPGPLTSLATLKNKLF